MINKGFTLIEILFAIAILAIALTIVVFSFSKLNSGQALDRSADLVTSILNEARSLTLSSKGDSQYGVYIEDSQLTLFKGNVYSSSDSANVVTELDSLVNIRDINLSGGGVSVVFKRLTGNTDEDGTLQIYLLAAPDNFRTITISTTGLIELE